MGQPPAPALLPMPLTSSWILSSSVRSVSTSLFKVSIWRSLGTEVRRGLPQPAWSSPARVVPAFQFTQPGRSGDPGTATGPLISTPSGFEHLRSVSPAKIFRDHSSQKAVSHDGGLPQPSPVVLHGAIRGSKCLLKEVSHHLPRQSTVTPAPTPPGQEGGPATPSAPSEEGAAHRWFRGRGPRADLDEVLGLLVLRGLLRNHHHRLDVLGQRRGPQEVGGSLRGQRVKATQRSPQQKALPLPFPQPTRGPTWCPGWRRPLEGAGTSGSRGIWMSRLK